MNIIKEVIVEIKTGKIKINAKNKFKNNLSFFYNNISLAQFSSFSDKIFESTNINLINILFKFNRIQIY